MSYESEFFEILKEAYVKKSWTDELYREMKNVFPKINIVFTYEADNGEKFRIIVTDERDKRTVIGECLSKGV